MRLGLHISSIGYLKNEATCFTEIIEHDNTGFDCKMVENEDGEKDDKEAVTNSEEKASKKRARRKTKRDAARARALLPAVVSRLSIPTSASIPVLRLFAAMPRFSVLSSTSIFMPRSSTAIPESSAAVPGSSVIVPRLSVAMPGLSATMPGLSVSAFAFVSVPELSAPVSLSAPVLLGSSPLLFPVLSLPKTLIPNLAVGRQKLDDTISGWSGRSKRVSLEELYSRRIQRATLEEAFLPRAPLFLLFFSSSDISKRKLDKTFINTWPLAIITPKKRSISVSRYASALWQSS